MGNSYVPYPLNRSNEGPTDLIVVLNVESVSCVSKSRGLVEISQVAPQVGVVYDTLLVTLKNFNYRLSVLYAIHAKKLASFPGPPS